MLKAVYCEDIHRKDDTDSFFLDWSQSDQENCDEKRIKLMHMIDCSHLFHVLFVVAVI